MFLASIDGTIVSTAMPTIVGDLPRHRPVRVGLLQLPARRDRDHPDLGPSRRHVRSQEDLPHRHGSLHARHGALRHLADDDGAHHLPRRAGPRRRVRAAGRADDQRRPLHDGAAGEGLSDLLGGLRAVRGARPVPRWLPHRRAVVALGVLRDPADRALRDDPGRGRDDRADPAPTPAQLRLGRCRDAARLERAARLRARDRRPRQPLALGPGHRDVRRRARCCSSRSS